MLVPPGLCDRRHLRAAFLAALAVVALTVFPAASSAHVALDPPAESPPTDAPAPPLALTLPRISGHAFKGQVLVCSPGTWAGAVQYTLLWSRDGIPREGRTAPSYRVEGADVEHTLTCSVTASNDVGWTVEDAPAVVAQRVAVLLRLDVERRQFGPTLHVVGRIESKGPPAVGTVVLLRDGELTDTGSVSTDGAFSFEESFWGLVPGRTTFEVRFQPRDSELHEGSSRAFRILVVSPATYPFPRSPLERPTTIFDDLPPFWHDGSSCSTGCRPPGAQAGWPLEPFHEQHGLRAGINELRDKGFHLGVDIQARARAPVYALQPGRAHVIQRTGSEARVQVGNYIYWHLKLLVHDGEWIGAFDKPLGIVLRDHRHLHLSEVDGSGGYLNPLRPGGRVLAPWSDLEPPVIGRPVVGGDGSLVVEAFDPQSFEERTRYVTPVLAPAALAWRLYDVTGRPLTPLRWALRGTHVLQPELVPAIFTAGARRPGYMCFAVETLCVPNWQYRLAWPGELAAAAGQRRARLTVYAWDWRGNTTARDVWLDRSH